MVDKIKEPTPLQKKKQHQKRWDEYINSKTRLGDRDWDSLQMSKFYRTVKLSDDDQENLYHDSHIAARIAEIIPEEELKQGYQLVIGDESYKDDLEDYLKAKQSGREAKKAASILMKMDDLNVREAFVDARVWSRVFGGAVIYVGIEDGSPQDSPVDMNNIQDISFLKVLDRRYLREETYYTDPLSPKFGMAATYRVYPQDLAGTHQTSDFNDPIIHESRLIRFEGSRTSNRRKRQNEGWSESIYQKMDEVLRQYGVSFQSVAHLMQKSSQSVLKMSGYIEALSANSPELIKLRLQEMQLSASVNNIWVVDKDADEDFHIEAHSFNAIPQILEIFMVSLSSATGIPVTKLMGQSPAGLNATGESDLRNFYDMIRASQKFFLKPKLEYLVKLIMLSKNGPTKGRELSEWCIDFPSLWQSTDLEKAEIKRMEAEAIKLLSEANLNEKTEKEPVAEINNKEEKLAKED